MKIPVTCDEGGRLERIPLEELTRFQGRLKTLSEDNYNLCRSSLLEHGFSFPVFYWRDKAGGCHIIDGHQRLFVVEKEGYEIEGDIPVVDIKAKDKREAARKLLSLNNTYGHLDGQGLYEFVHDMDIDAIIELPKHDLPGIDIDSFLEEFYDVVEAGNGEGDGDNVPDVQDKVISQAGDLWLLGRHRVLCGDSTKEEDVSRLMDGIMVRLILTDPPYGINQDGITNDEPHVHQRLIAGAISNFPLNDGICISFASTRTFPVWLDLIRENGYNFQRMLWLYKSAQCTYPWRGWILTSESILVATRGKNLDWQEIKPYSHDCYSLSEVSGELSDDLGWHGSVKPLNVVVDLLKRTCGGGGMVYDPFLGSGTTLIAAEKEDKVCYGMEIAPQYVDVIVRRWQEFTGEEAVLEETDEPFSVVSKRR